MSEGIERVDDGLTHKPVFLIRNLLRLLPGYYVAQAVNRSDDESACMPVDMFCKSMAASYVGKRDLEITIPRRNHIKNFQRCYLQLIEVLGEQFAEVLKTIQERSAIINHRHRMTGDAVLYIIEEIIAMKERRIHGLQAALNAFIASQVLIPGEWQPVKPEQLRLRTFKSRLLITIHENLELYKESI